VQFLDIAGGNVARKKIQKHQLFWAMATVVFLWGLGIVVIKVWHVAYDPEKALKEEPRYHAAKKTAFPLTDRAINNSIQNFIKIQDGKVTEKAKWPNRVSERSLIAPVAEYRDEQAPSKDTTINYYGELYQKPP
jgi:hypothetical protein